MKKNKLMSVVAIAILFGFSISIILHYNKLANIESLSLDSYVIYVMKNARETLNYTRDISQAVYDIQSGTSLRNEYPMVITVTDEVGNIVATTSNNLLISGYNAQNEHETIFVSLDEWLTDEIEESFRLLTDRKRVTCLMVDNVSLYYDGNSYIPVEMHVYNANKKELETTVRFSDKKANLSTDEGWYSAELYLSTLDKDDHYKKIMKKLYAESSEYIESFDFQGYVQGDYGLTQNSTHAKYISDYENENDGKTYYIFMLAEYDQFYKVVKSVEFRDDLVTISIIFLIFGILTEAAVGFIINKIRLEKAKTAFITAAAHELKTPLAVIANQCECILENVNPENDRKYVASVYDECKKMNRMVKTLIEYSRIRSENKIKREKFSLRDCAETEIEKYKSLIDSKDMSVLSDMPDEAVINADKEMIRLVIDNFISNAVKFALDETEIKIKIEKINKVYRFSIFNVGSGISHEDGEHIWEELYKGDKARTRSDNSTGMGLAVSRIILENHKFKYGYKNEKDGVTFFFIT